MNIYNLPDTLERDMQKAAQRQRIQAYQGEVATPRTFVKTGEYTGSELRSKWRHTIWDTVPSRMSQRRQYPDGSVELID